MDLKNISFIDDKSDMNLNGLLFANKYIPQEVLLEIFYLINYEQLLMCHLVCKQWNMLIKDRIWQRKAECISGGIFLNGGVIPWTSYYFICKNKPFNKNLLLSNTVELIDAQNFKIVELERNLSECIQPFPDDSAFRNLKHCAVIPKSYYSLNRKFIINLIKEGFSEYILDTIQPTIKISEWFCCKQKELNAEYKCSIKLLKSYSENNHRIMRAFHFHKELKEINQRGQWLKFTHEFKNYGKGLRLIKFYDGGNKEVILAGPCIKLIMK